MPTHHPAHYVATIDVRFAGRSQLSDRVRRRDQGTSEARGGGGREAVVRRVAGGPHATRGAARRRCPYGATRVRDVDVQSTRPSSLAMLAPNPHLHPSTLPPLSRAVRPRVRRGCWNARGDGPHSGGAKPWPFPVPLRHRARTARADRVCPHRQRHRHDACAPSGGRPKAAATTAASAMGLC